MLKIFLAIGVKELSIYLKKTKSIIEKNLKTQVDFIGETTYKEGILKGVSDYQPDILIIREGLDGLISLPEILYEIKLNYPETRIIFLAGDREPGDALLATLVQYGIYDLIIGSKIDGADIIRRIVQANRFSDVSHLLPKITIDSRTNNLIFNAPEKPIINPVQKIRTFKALNPLSKKEDDELIFIEDEENQLENIDTNKLINNKNQYDEELIIIDKNEDLIIIDDDETEIIPTPIKNESKVLSKRNPLILGKNNIEDKINKEKEKQRLKIEADISLAETERIKMEAEAKLKEEQKLKKELEDKLAETERLKIETEEKLKREAEEKLKELEIKLKEEQKLKQELEDKLKKEQILKKEKDDRLKEELRLKNEEELRLKKENEIRLKEEQRIANEAEVELKKELDRKLKEEQKLKRKNEREKKEEQKQLENKIKIDLKKEKVIEKDNSGKGLLSLLFGEKKDMKRINKQVLTFMGGSAGVGNSQISFNVALKLAENGNKVIYLDLNDRFSSIDYILQLGYRDVGINTAFEGFIASDYNLINRSILTVPNLLNNTDESNYLYKTYEKLPTNLSFMFFSQDYMERNANKSLENTRLLSDLMMYLLLTGGYDYIILDAPADIYNELSEIALIYSTKIFFTLTQDVSIIGNHLNTIKIINKKGINFKDKFYYLINKNENTQMNLKEIYPLLTSSLLVEDLDIVTIPNVNKELINANYLGQPLLMLSKSRELNNAFISITKLILK